MNNVEKLKVVETILERAATNIGDITNTVMEEFYRTEPELQSLFTQHRPVNTIQLEAGMVEQALHCFMRWFESPGEVEMTLLGSVPHHVETLNVGVKHYRKLLLAMSSVILQSIPLDNACERNVWDEITDNLLGVVELADRNVFPGKAS
ncbi:MAG: hypothetical protein CMK89_21825 [Pseudomonadales bacterium]|nr:hypothetical protein [Pseudomonadales bacterium]